MKKLWQKCLVLVLVVLMVTLCAPTALACPWWADSYSEQNYFATGVGETQTFKFHVKDGEIAILNAYSWNGYVGTLTAFKEGYYTETLTDGCIIKVPQDKAWSVWNKIVKTSEDKDLALYYEFDDNMPA